MTNLKAKDGKWIVDTSEPIPGEFVERRIKGKTCVCAKRRRTRATYVTKTEALAALALLRSGRALRKMGIEPPAEDKPKRTIFEVYVKQIQAEKAGLRNNSVANLGRIVTALTESPIFKGKLIEQITTADVARYHTDRRTCPSAANTELQFLRSVLGRAVEEGLITRNPANPIKRCRIGEARFRILSDKEVDLLLAAASPDVAVLIRTLVTTAMRPHEALSLIHEYDGWDTEKKLDRAVLSISRGLIHIPGDLAKNHKDREIPLSPQLEAMFEARGPIEPGSRVFPWRGARTPDAFESAVKAAMLKNVFPYALRHTALSRMCRAGVDIKTVSEIAGHSNISITSRYLHSDGESKRAAIERVSGIYMKPDQAADSPAAREGAQVEAQDRALEN